MLVSFYNLWPVVCDAAWYYNIKMSFISLDLDLPQLLCHPRYLGASAYSKEMIILVDKSGSMKGRSDIISNATVTEILNTLTENDFFNVIMVNEILIWHP